MILPVKLKIENFFVAGDADNGDDDDDSIAIFYGFQWPVKSLLVCRVRPMCDLFFNTELTLVVSAVSCRSELSDGTSNVKILGKL